ncbi:hypothetical protein LTS18_010141 [Coniosporium uncinatum]|uniref:Uncharacterized protein n=1 Tax=Coniosporium uncinatum TaxID=93489 RepID=A0ACC3DLM8_9PEZI|nr:hypothetical protein LTS18_010141 [Coniosporium uncinatum]
MRFVRSGVCRGLDLGGNDLDGRINSLSEALTPNCPLWALSLADCNLTPQAIKPLFPAIARLADFRFLDLSHNRQLFAQQPSTLQVMRQYLPRLPILKRMHLVDVGISPAQAIGLAEVLAEMPYMAHLNILENPQLSALASAKDEASQEEACALYASLMAACRISKSIICIDIDVPSPDNSEVVKALAKQVVAYCLRNMERFTASEAPEVSEAVAAITGGQGGATKEVDVPDVLMHLVGHLDGYGENHDYDPPAPDNDYIVGGTGVVKALNYCLSEKASDLKRNSLSMPPSGTGTPRTRQVDQNHGAKAKHMSRSLLSSARKIRSRLQPALAREAQTGDEMAYSESSFHTCKIYTNACLLERLIFLDDTLKGMIARFEDEYPECRLTHEQPSELSLTDNESTSSSPSNSLFSNRSHLPTDPSSTTDVDSTRMVESDEEFEKRPRLHSRQASDVSLASRALSQEEGRMHRLGQRVRREVLRPQTEDYAHGTTGNEEPEPSHISALRQKLEALSGTEFKDKVHREGLEETFRSIKLNEDELRRLEKEDPEEFRAFRDAQLAAQANAALRLDDDALSKR